MSGFQCCVFPGVTGVTLAIKLVSQEEVYIPLASPVSWLLTVPARRSPTYTVVCLLRGSLGSSYAAASGRRPSDLLNGNFCTPRSADHG